MTTDYISYDDYQNVKGLDAITEERFEELYFFAKDIVDGLTFSVIENKQLYEDEDYKPRITRAMALIIDALNRNGIEAVADSDIAHGVASKSESIGGYSYSISYREGAGGSSYGLKIPSLARFLLRPIVALGRQS